MEHTIINLLELLLPSESLLARYQIIFGKGHMFLDKTDTLSVMKPLLWNVGNDTI